MKSMELGPNESALMPSASAAIGSNGYKILRAPKYAEKITKTRVTRMPGAAICKMAWLDADDKLVAWHTGEYDPDRYPLLGEVVEVDSTVD